MGTDSMSVTRGKQRVAIRTGIVDDDASAARLALGVEELLADYPSARVIWMQTPVERTTSVRITAAITYIEKMP